MEQYRNLHLKNAAIMAAIVVTTLFFAGAANAQTEQDVQQVTQQAELAKQREEQQAELAKQREELAKQQVEQQAELAKQRAELAKQRAEQQAVLVKQRVEQQAELAKQREEQQAVLVKQRVEQQAELAKQREEQQAVLVKQREEQQAELAKQRAEQQTEQAKQRAEQAKQRTEQAKQRAEQAEQRAEQAKQRAEQAKQRAEQAKQRQRQQSALSEYEIVMKKEYTVGSSPSLSISNRFGNIRIIEGADDKIVFNLTITGKGKDKDAAKKQAESVDVKFIQSGDKISAKTVFKEIQCNNCGRNVSYEVAVPRNTKQVLENKHGDIKVNKVVASLDVNLQFGKLYANELSEANLTIQHGGATIKKCGNLKIKSGFSKYELGVTGAMTGSLSHDGLKIDELGSADLKSDFSNVDIGKLKQSIHAEKFSYGALKIGYVDENFSRIKVDANFSTVKVALTKNHNFKTVLYSSFGNIKTGNVAFYEKSLDKKDAVVGIAGKYKEPSASVEISNTHGSVVFE